MKEEKKNYVGSKDKKFEGKSIKIAKKLHLPPPLLYTCVRDTAFKLANSSKSDVPKVLVVPFSP